MSELNEEQSQVEFVNWLRREHGEWWEALHHSPNGGARSRIVGQKMKMMGTKRGFPDLVFYKPSGIWMGLVIELKVKNRKASPEQKVWLQRLDECGYMTAVCNGIEAAKAAFINYLECKEYA
jgi:hypothetical protein